MKHEFNQVLQVGAEEEKQEEKKQEKLKRKFGIQGKNVVIVERTNMIKFTVRVIAAISCHHSPDRSCIYRNSGFNLRRTTKGADGYFMECDRPDQTVRTVFP